MADEENSTNISVEPHVLCTRCSEFVHNFQRNHILNSDDGKSARFTYRAPGREVQESGLRGCHFCSTISQGLCPAHSDRDLLESRDWFITIGRVQSVSRSSSPKFTADMLLKDPDGKVIKRHSMWIVSDLKITHPPVSSWAWSVSTSSDATFKLAQEWLDQCLANHKICEEVRMKPSSRNGQRFPSYLVDIGSAMPRLCHFKDRSERPDYLTLSHRWGGSHIFQLTTKNVLSLLSEIPLPELPKTFRDAIMIARRLGHRFLWIDSLCIMQDSKEHWQTESSIMGDIYRGSVFTIAALGAADGDSGCFKSRNPLCFQYCKLGLKLENQELCLEPQEEGKQWRKTGYGKSVEPLHERAWVMQERMLSPRTLYYGTLGLYWECVAEAATHTASKAQSQPPTPKYVINKMSTLPVSGSIDESYREFHKWWERTVELYNSCGLTYGSDKLVAIAGIIKLVEHQTGLHNVAGLWKESALLELLWMIEKPTERPTGSYQGPTWSWTSLNTPTIAGIQDFNYEFDWKAEVLEMVAHQVAANGQISGAHLRVRAPMQLVCWEKDVDGDNYKLRWGTEAPVENSANDRIMFQPDIDVEHKIESEQELWALLVVHCTAATSWMKMGLVVTRKQGDVEGEECWIRVGSFRQYDWPSCPTTFFEDGGEEIRVLVIV